MREGGGPMPRRLQAILFRVVPTVALVGLATYSVFGDHGFLELLERRREAEAARAELVRVEKSNEQLLLRIRQVQDDPVALERLVADELGLVRPGGALYVFVDEDDQPTARLAPDRASATP